MPFDVVVTELIRKTFVGAVPVGNAHLALDKCKQVYYDKDAKRLVALTVQEYYTAFTNTLMGLPTDQPYPVDVAHVFRHNLETNIQNLLVHRGHVFPPRDPNESNAAAQHRIYQIFEAALHIEQDLIATHRSQQLYAWTGSNNLHNFGPRSFLTTATSDTYTDPSLATLLMTQGVDVASDLEAPLYPHNCGPSSPRQFYRSRFCSGVRPS